MVQMQRKIARTFLETECLYYLIFDFDPTGDLSSASRIAEQEVYSGVYYSPTLSPTLTLYSIFFLTS